MAKVTQAHIDARTEAILAAAERMFVRKGVDAATMSEIASEAGLSAGAIYRYFPSKEELLLAVCGVAVDEARAMFDHAAASTDSPLAAIADIGRAAWNKLKEEDHRESAILNLEATLVGARQGGALGEAQREVFRALIDMLSGFIGEAQRAGQIAAHADARALAGTLLACHLGSGLLALQLEDEINTDDVFDVLMEMLGSFAPKGAD